MLNLAHFLNLLLKYVILFKDEDEKIYRYGYILLCEVALNNLVIDLVIGIVYSKIKIIMFFIFFLNMIFIYIIQNMMLLLEVENIEKY